MLDMAKISTLVAENDDRSLNLDLSECRLIQGYRQMTEQERRQIRRLVEQLTNNPAE